MRTICRRLCSKYARFRPQSREGQERRANPCAMLAMMSRDLYLRHAVLVVIVVVAAAGCSPKRMGISRMADALTSTASAFTRDNDPEFVRQAAPSTLKMIEMLLEESPAHTGLLMTACSGFTQYAYAFLQADADTAPPGSTTAR